MNQTRLVQILRCIFFSATIGISKIKPADVESLWNNISKNTEVSDFLEANMLKPNAPKPSNWPIVMFLSFIFAGPYLMWKLIRSLNLDPAQKGIDSNDFVSSKLYSRQ
jgi:hypothetical protein